MPPRSRNKQQHGNRPRSTSLHVNVSADTVDNQQTTNQPEVAGGRRREIPDSQEDPADYDFSDSNEDELLAEESIEEYSTDEEEASEAENIRKAILAWWLDHIDTTAAPAPAPAPNSQPPYVSFIITSFSFQAGLGPCRLCADEELSYILPVSSAAAFRHSRFDYTVLGTLR